MADETERRTRGLQSTLGAALSAGLVAGLFWGLGDGVVAGLHAGTQGALVWTGCLAAAVVVHGALASAFLVLAAPLAHVRLRGRTLLERRRWLLGLAFGLALFLDIYWWTRPYVLWGVPASDPGGSRRRAGSSPRRRSPASSWRARAGAAARRERGWGLVAAAVGSAGLVLLAAARRAASARGAIAASATATCRTCCSSSSTRCAPDVLGCYGNERVRRRRSTSSPRAACCSSDAIVQAPFTWTELRLLPHRQVPAAPRPAEDGAGRAHAPRTSRCASHLKSRGGGRPTLRPATSRRDVHDRHAVPRLGAAARASTPTSRRMVGHELVTRRGRGASSARDLLLVTRVKTKLDAALRSGAGGDPARALARGATPSAASSRMVHYYSTHTPYDPPARYRGLYSTRPTTGRSTPSTPATARRSSAASTTPTPADVDADPEPVLRRRARPTTMIGEVLAELERRGVLDDTLVIVTADHGEELGDHGLWEHNYMFQTNLRVPLVMAWPKGRRAGARVAGAGRVHRHPADGLRPRRPRAALRPGPGARGRARRRGEPRAAGDRRAPGAARVRLLGERPLPGDPGPGLEALRRRGGARARVLGGDARGGRRARRALPSGRGPARARERPRRAPRGSRAPGGRAAPLECQHAARPRGLRAFVPRQAVRGAPGGARPRGRHRPRPRRLGKQRGPVGPED